MRLSELESELQRVSSQSDDAVGRVARVRAEMELQLARVEEAKAALSVAMETVAETERQLAALDAQHRVLLESLGERARTLYRLGRWGYLRLFFSLTRSGLGDVGEGQQERGEGRTMDSNPPPDPLAGVRLLRALVRQDAKAVDELRANREQAVAVTSSLRRRQEEARSWLDRQRLIGQELEQRRRAERAALQALESRKAEIASELVGIQSRHQRMSSLMEILSREGSGGLGGLAIEEFAGALDWPVVGTVARRFGPYRDSQYGTLVPHNGITIASTAGASVRAVYPGRVVYSGRLRDVGLVVVLQHTEDALTLYSGLRRVDVREGDVVALGHELGVNDRELYFEIRRGKQALDPEDWLN